MKSFLTGEAEIRLGLNEDLTIGREERRRGSGGVILDDCNFHESAQLENFDRDRSLSIVAPDGEVGYNRFALPTLAMHSYLKLYNIMAHILRVPFSLNNMLWYVISISVYLFCILYLSMIFILQFTLMNYRVTGDFLNSIPFRVYTTVEDGDLPKSLRLCIRLKSEVTQKT